MRTKVRIYFTLFLLSYVPVLKAQLFWPRKAACLLQHQGKATYCSTFSLHDVTVMNRQEDVLRPKETDLFHMQAAERIPTRIKLISWAKYRQRSESFLHSTPSQQRTTQRLSCMRRSTAKSESLPELLQTIPGMTSNCPQERSQCWASMGIDK